MKKYFLILVAAICFCNIVSAQTECEFETSTFLLLIENTEDGIKLTSRKGCEFGELSFPLKKGQSQEIDQFGLRDSKDLVRLTNDDNLASFRFSITKLSDGSALEVALEGIEGTVWKNLSFAIPSGSQLIDQNGMAMPMRQRAEMQQRREAMLQQRHEAMQLSMLRRQEVMQQQLVAMQRRQEEMQSAIQRRLEVMQQRQEAMQQRHDEMQRRRETILQGQEE
jgi:hypothetical protein